MRLVIAGILAAVILFLTPAIASAHTTADPSCSIGASFGAEITKAPVHIGQKTGIDAYVYTSPGFSTFPPGCPLTNVHAVVTFADGSTKTIVKNGSVAGAGAMQQFIKNVKVKASYITDDPTYGEIMQITITITAVCEGVTFTGNPTYAVQAVV